MELKLQATRIRVTIFKNDCVERGFSPPTFHRQKKENDAIYILIAKKHERYSHPQTHSGILKKMTS
jgi:hypothetical protein